LISLPVVRWHDGGLAVDPITVEILVGALLNWSRRMSWRAKLMLGWMSGASGRRARRLHRVPVSDRRGVTLRMFQAGDRIRDLARWGFGGTTF
jgi:hypothetical protein